MCVSVCEGSCVCVCEGSCASVCEGSCVCEWRGGFLLITLKVTSETPTTYSQTWVGGGTK